METCIIDKSPLSPLFQRGEARGFRRKFIQGANSFSRRLESMIS